MNKGLRILLLGALLALSSGCAVVDAGGRMIGSVGDALTNTGNEKDIPLLRAGGRIYTDIGVSVRAVAAGDQEKKKSE